MNLHLFKRALIISLTVFSLAISFHVLAQDSDEGETNPDTDNPYITSPEASDEGPMSEENQKKQRDFDEYLRQLTLFKDASTKEQIQNLEQFLEDHPDTSVKNEIQGNLQSLKATLRAEEEAKVAKNIQDKEDYEKFRAEIKGLAPSDQIARYDEFIKTHSDSAVIDTAKNDQQALVQAQLKASAGQQPAGQPAAQAGQAAPVLPLAPPGNTKDPNHAIFMAAVPGLFVPGMGSFYAGDSATGVVLVLVRVAGYTMGGVGVARHSNGLIITGALAAGFSYLLDIAAAPILARDYNEKLEKKASLSVTPCLIMAERRPAIGLYFNF
jgi:hypothetical protein